MEPDFIELSPPTTGEVVARALALSIVLYRNQFEIDLGRGHDRGELVSDLADMRKHVQETEMGGVLSPKEQKLFQVDLGEWQEVDIVDQSWRQESLYVILWALKVIHDLPPYDQQARLPRGFHPEDIEEMHLGRRAAELRNSSEIQDARDAAELWHWRAVTTRIATTPIEEGGNSFAEIIASAAKTAFENGWSSAPIEGDFPALGKPYRDLTEPEYRGVASIALERHRALNWLCGFERNWDEVPVDT